METSWTNYPGIDCMIDQWFEYHDSLCTGGDRRGGIGNALADSPMRRWDGDVRSYIRHQFDSRRTICIVATDLNILPLIARSRPNSSIPAEWLTATDIPHRQMWERFAKRP